MYRYFPDIEAVLEKVQTSCKSVLIFKRFLPMSLRGFSSDFSIPPSPDFSNSLTFLLTTSAANTGLEQGSESPFSLESNSFVSLSSFYLFPSSVSSFFAISRMFSNTALKVIFLPISCSIRNPNKPSFFKLLSRTFGSSNIAEWLIPYPKRHVRPSYEYDSYSWQNSV